MPSEALNGILEPSSVYHCSSLTTDSSSLLSRCTRFHVDKDSDLYYNPTPLLEVIRKELEDDSPDIQTQIHVPQHGHHLPPGHPGSIPHLGQQPPPGAFHPGARHQTPMRSSDPRGDFHNMPPGMHPQMVQGGGHPHGPPPSAQMNFPSSGFPGSSVMNMRQGFPGAPFNAGPPGQFFNNDSGASPMRGPPGHMGGMNVNVGMPGGGMAGMGGMSQRGMPPSGMNLNMPPEMRRMRGMPEDFPIH